MGVTPYVEANVAALRITKVAALAVVDTTFETLAGQMPLTLVTQSRP